MAIVASSCRIGLRPAANAGSDRFLGGGVFLSVPLRLGLNRVGGLHGFDLLGQIGNAWPFLFSRLLGRGGKASLELVTQGGQFR
jgi:hypothetical protein